MPVRGEDVACERAERDGTSTGARAPKTLKSARDRAVPLVSLCTLRGSGSVGRVMTHVSYESRSNVAQSGDVIRVTARAARNTNSPGTVLKTIRLYFTSHAHCGPNCKYDNMHTFAHTGHTLLRC